MYSFNYLVTEPIDFWIGFVSSELTNDIDIDLDIVINLYLVKWIYVSLILLFCFVFFSFEKYWNSKLYFTIYM